jgi:hypothetical protein
MKCLFLYSSSSSPIDREEEKKYFNQGAASRKRPSEIGSLGSLVFRSLSVSRSNSSWRREESKIAASCSLAGEQLFSVISNVRRLVDTVALVVRLESLCQIDPLHQDLGTDDEGHLIQTTRTEDFYDEIDRSCFGVEDNVDTVSFSDMASALSLIVDYCCDSKHVNIVASRIMALQVLLSPTSCKFGRTDLAAVARDCGITRAAVSKSLIEFRDQVGTSLTVGHRSSSRERCRQAQEHALRRGIHASDVRKAKRAAKAAQAAMQADAEISCVPSAQ